MPKHKRFVTRHRLVCYHKPIGPNGHIWTLPHPLFANRTNMASSLLARSAICIILLLCTCANPTHGFQNYRSRVPNGAGVPCPPEDETCTEGDLCEGLGHLSCLGGGDTPERNAFGKDFEAEGKSWTAELCNKDSDGDGFSNGYELGDPCCIWHEGANIPQWMRDWQVSHPGFGKSTQVANEIDLKEFCKDKKPLESESFYNEGEPEVTMEYFIKDHMIPAEETVYEEIRFNFPDNATYDIVGIEPIIDNKELVHHYVVTACTETSPKVGIPLDGSDMESECKETIFLWAPGFTNFTLPKNTAVRIGKGTKRVGFNIQMHYDNPKLKSDEKDSSGIRFHMTTKQRQYEIGILFTGTDLSVGAIPPNKKWYSSTIFQINVDEEAAPEGVKVFGFSPHMHLLGRRMWTERLIRTDEDNGELLTDLTKLEKFKDLGRDDKWRFDVQYYGRLPETKVEDGEYWATTCLYDSSDRTEPTSGGLGSRDEMCINFIYYYPADALDYALIYSGPRYAGPMSDEEFKSLDSALEILSFESETSFLPKWREAYLKGELVCNDTLPGHDFSAELEAPIGNTDEDLFFEALETGCGEYAGYSLFAGNELVEWECSPDCAALLYNAMGCALVRDAKKGGKTMPLVPSPREAIVDYKCKQEFADFYDKNKVEVPTLGSETESETDATVDVESGAVKTGSFIWVVASALVTGFTGIVHVLF